MINLLATPVIYQHTNYLEYNAINLSNKNLPNRRLLTGVQASYRLVQYLSYSLILSFPSDLGNNYVLIQGITKLMQVNYKFYPLGYIKLNFLLYVFINNSALSRHNTFVQSGSALSNLVNIIIIMKYAYTSGWKLALPSSSMIVTVDDEVPSDNDKQLGNNLIAILNVSLSSCIISLLMSTSNDDVNDPAEMVTLNTSAVDTA